MSCPTSLIETYLDGELPPERMLELQAHIDVCSQCADLVALETSLRQSLRRVTYEEGAVTPEFRARLTAALQETELALAAPPPPPSRTKRRPRELLPYLAAPFAVAAAAVLWFGKGKAPELSGEPQRAAVQATTNDVVTAVDTDELLDRLLDYHSAPPVPEVTEPRLVPRLERDVGVRLRVPTLINAEWQGASVVPVTKGLRAATLRYKLPDEHSVTIYVYDASRVPVHAALQERVIRRQGPVYVGYRRGYSIAALERRGLGYAVASDRDDTESIELVTSLH